MLKIKQLDDGVILEVRVQPKASSNRIAGVHDGALKLSVTAPPENGKANKAVVALLAKSLGIKKHDVSIVSGETSRNKRVKIVGFDKKQLLTMIDQLKKD